MPGKYLILILSFILLSSCAEDLGDNDSSRDGPQGEETNISRFSTRLSNTLLIAGQRCEGTETTTDVNGFIVTCARDQWLITLDDVNTCTPGGCTEIGVIPFVAELDRFDRVSITPSSYFEIDPISAITPARAATIDDYLVRFDLSDETATVVPK